MNRVVIFLGGMVLIALGCALAYLTWIISPHDASGISKAAAVMRYVAAWVLGWLVWVPIGFGFLAAGSVFSGDP